MKRSLVTAFVATIGIIGCVEFQQMMIPDKDPDWRFNYNFNDNDNDVDTNGVGNDNDNNADTNGVDNGNVNDNADANNNVNSNDNTAEDPLEAQIQRINAGEVGEIPAISPNIQQVVTDTGLRYFDIVVGGGEFPLPDDTVTAAYTGWLADDGSQFDTSASAQFQLQGLIPAWQEGLASMQVGGKRRLIVPPELGYGEQGSPPTIPPNATLVFDVELLSIP